jgi:hypothetical protein
MSIPLSMQRQLVSQMPSYTNASPTDDMLRQLNNQDSVMDQASGSIITQYVTLSKSSHQGNSQSNNTTVDNTLLPQEVASALAGRFTNVALETKVLFDLNKEFNKEVSRRTNGGGAQPSNSSNNSNNNNMGIPLKVARAQRMEVLKKEILEKYSVDLAGEQMRDKSSPPRWVEEFLGDAQWRTVLKELIAKYPSCQLLTYAAREMVKRGHVGEITDLQTAARVPSIFMNMAGELIPLICQENQGNSQEEVPAHVAREQRIIKLCSVAHQNEATLIYAIQLMSKLQCQRFDAEGATAFASPSFVLLRLTHLLQRLRDWSFVNVTEQEQLHQPEMTRLASAMFRWSCHQDRTCPSEASIQAVDELRCLASKAHRERLSRKKQSAKMSRINPITTVQFVQKYHSVVKASSSSPASASTSSPSSSSSSLAMFRDSIGLDALLLDLVFPFAQLKTQHRSEIAGCVATILTGTSGNDRNKLETLLKHLSNICNTLAAPNIYYDQKARMNGLVTTKIVARGLMFWVQASLDDPKLYDEQSYQR